MFLFTALWPDFSISGEAEEAEEDFCRPEEQTDKQHKAHTSYLSFFYTGKIFGE